MFQNESQDVARKAEAKIGSRRQSPASATPNSARASNETGSRRTESTIQSAQQKHHKSLTSLNLTCDISPTTSERALGFFSSNYVIKACSWDRILDDSMLASVKALGLAGFSSIAYSPGILIEAKKQYIEAIRLTNAAISSPIDVKKDSTLVSVTILSVFETVTGSNRRSLTDWTNHIKGAAALLELRGLEPLSTPGGRYLFGQVTSSLVSICSQYDLEVPESILKLRTEASKYNEPDDLLWRWYESLFSCTNFRARVRRGTISNTQTILQSALELDRRVLSLFSDVAPIWRYSTVYTEADPNIVYAGYYHMYQNYMSAQMWNGMRSYRIMIHRIIYDTLLSEMSSKSPLFSIQQCLAQIQRSLEVSNQMQSDILASVPQHTGYTSKNSAEPLSSDTHALRSDPLVQRFLWSDFAIHRPYPSQQTVSASNDIPIIRMSNEYNLLWALYHAGAMALATESSRKWVIQTLRSIGRVMVIHQAMVLADMLEKNVEIGTQKTWRSANLSPSTASKEIGMDIDL